MEMDITGFPPRASPLNVSASAQETGDRNGTFAPVAHDVPQDGMAAPTIRAIDDDEPPIPVLQVVDHEKEAKGPQLNDDLLGPPCLSSEFDDSLTKRAENNPEETQLQNGPQGPPLSPRIAALGEEDLDEAYGGELSHIAPNLRMTAGDQTDNPSHANPIGLNANVSTIDVPLAIAVDNEIIEATPTLPFWKQRRVRIMLGLVILAVVILVASLGVAFTRESTVTKIVGTTSSPTESLVPTSSPSEAPSTSLEPSSAPSSCDAKIYATNNELQLPQQNPDTPAIAIEGRDMIIVSRNELLHFWEETSSLYIMFYHRSEETNDWELAETEIQSNIDWDIYCGTLYEVSLSYETAVVGVPNLDIFVFKKNNFGLWEKVQAPTLPGYRAGRSVAAGNGLLAVAESQWCAWKGGQGWSNPGPHVHFFAESGDDWVALGQPLTSVQTYYDYVLVSGNMIAVGKMGDMVVDLYHYDESKRDINEMKNGEDWSLNKYVYGLAQVSSLPAVGRVSFYGESRLAAFNGHGTVGIHSIDGQKLLQIIRSNSTGFGRNIDSDEDMLMISSDGQVHLYSENESGLFEELLTLDLDYGSYRLSDRNLLIVNGGNSSIHTIDISECIPSADISEANDQGVDDCYDVNVTLKICSGDLDVTLQTSEFIASDATLIDLNQMGFDYDDENDCSEYVYGSCVQKGRYQLNAQAGGAFIGCYAVYLSVEGMMSQSGRFVIYDECVGGMNGGPAANRVDQRVAFGVPFKQTDDQPFVASFDSPSFSEAVSTYCAVSTPWPTEAKSTPHSTPFPTYSPNITMHPSETSRPSPVPSITTHPSETFRPTPIPSISMHPSETSRPTLIPSISKSPASPEAASTPFPVSTPFPTVLTPYPAPFPVYSPSITTHPSETFRPSPIPSITTHPSETSRPTPIPSISKSPTISPLPTLSWTHQAKLQFGERVAIDQDTIVVGAGGYDDSGVYNGSRHVFVRSGGEWAHQAELLAPNALDTGGFKKGVAIHKDTIVVGAQGYDDKGGRSESAHVFVRSGGEWTHQAMLLAQDTDDEYTWFGESVAIHEDTIVVGAPLEYSDSIRGSAQVFVRSGGEWTYQAKLLAPDLAAFGGSLWVEFGECVAIHQDTIVVGARDEEDDDNRGSYYIGSAYVFVRSGGEWTHQAKLLAHPFGWIGPHFDWFGKSVAIHEDTIVVGAEGDGDWSGSAHVFVRSGGKWTKQVKLRLPGGAAVDRFGYSVAIYEDTIVVGAPGDDENRDNSGSANVFVRNGEEWTRQAKLLVSEKAAGMSVTIYDDIIVVSANEDGVLFRGGRSAHVFVS